MNCLLGGKESKHFEMLIPHGKIEMDVVGTNWNYIFFLSEYWKDLPKTIRLKFGSCHLGEGVPENPTVSEPIKSEFERVEEFHITKTEGDRWTIKATLIGKTGQQINWREYNKNKEKLISRFIAFAHKCS